MTPQPITCIRCQGSGTSHPMDSIKAGILLDLCPGCRGSGELTDPGPNPPFRAMFMVGTRFLVRLTVDREVGGFRQLDVDWSPQMPRPHGKGCLKPSEKKDYESMRDLALRQFMAEMGGGDWSVIAAGDRH